MFLNGFPITELQREFLKDFGGGLCKGFIEGHDPVSIVHYTRPGSSIKRPTLTLFAILHQVTWGVVYPQYNHGSSIKPPSQNIFEESSLQL